MALKKNTRYPNFILGAVSLLLFVIGVIIRANFAVGTTIVFIAVGLGAVHWIWGITDIITGYDLNPRSKTFWLIIVTLIPPLGGMIYYLMKRKNVSI